MMTSGPLDSAQAVTDPSVDVLLLIRNDKEGSMTWAQVDGLAQRVLGPHNLTYSITDWPTGAYELTNRPQVGS